MTTPEVSGEQTLRILVPRDYYTDTTRRYPVFYFLHGVGDDPSNPALAYPALKATQEMITVIPDGGIRGWYTDWVRQNTAAGAQNWQTFHLEQVVPFIDDDFRTIATKAGRAVGGLSMGGFVFSGSESGSGGKVEPACGVPEVVSASLSRPRR